MTTDDMMEYTREVIDWSRLPIYIWSGKKV